MAEYIDRAALMSLVESEAHRWGDDYDWWQCLADIEDFPAADVVSWAYMERYANWFCADVSFPEFIREAKAFLTASGADMKSEKEDK